jgi:DNA-binding winged helix-turn-helix (wHTH) protein
VNHFQDQRAEIAAAVSRLQSLGAEKAAARAAASASRPPTENRVLRFGIFELDTRTLELRREGRLIHLRLQSVQVLRMLLDRSGELVTRSEITDALWPDDVDVDVEQGLNHCVKEVRVALGDSKEAPRYLQTLPRRGYRMLVEVQEIRDNRADPAKRDEQERLVQVALQAAFNSGLRAALEAQAKEVVDEDASAAPARRGFE